MAEPRAEEGFNESTGSTASGKMSKAERDMIIKRLLEVGTGEGVWGWEGEG